MKNKLIKFFTIFALLTLLFGAVPASPAGADAKSSFLAWNTFLGDSGYDEGWSVAVDGAGNVYVAGNSDTAWGDTPVRAYTGNFDVFVAKLNSSGVLQWHTFLGGSGEDMAASIAVDADGFVYITGQSDATWDGVTPIRAHTSGIDAFAAKLYPNGFLNWHTFLGSNAGDYGKSIALGGDGFVYVTGFGGTWGSPLQEHNGNQDAFVSKLWGTGILEWNTFLGSNTFDAGTSIAVDAGGNIYVSGTSEKTWGTPVRAHSSGYEAFAAKLNSAGALQWNTFLGGIGSDYGNAIALDGTQALYLTGESDATWGSPLRVYSSDQDAFAAKLNPATGALQWNTFLGGGESDQGRGIAVGGGNVYVAGLSGSSWGSPIRGYSGGFDAFVVKLNPSGALQWNSFLGGSNYDLGAGIAVDGSGNIYMTGQSHAAWGTPVEAYTSDGDAFVAMMPPPVPTFVDVPFNSFAWSQIQSIYTAGITGGCTITPLNYCPNNRVNRAQMAIFLLRGIHGSSYTPPDATGTVFADVPANAFAAAWIEQLAEEGITGGCGGGNYCPNNTVTRSQMAIFLLRAKYDSSHTPPDPTGGVFGDVPSGAFAAAWIEQLVAEGITGGCGSGNYCPNNPVTRSQMAIFLQRTFALTTP